jgi:hypothetical protein
MAVEVIAVEVRQEEAVDHLAAVEDSIYPNYIYQIQNL